jgi:hypothetical protein
LLDYIPHKALIKYVSQAYCERHVNVWKVTDTTMVDNFIWNFFDTCKFHQLDVASNREDIPKYQRRLDQHGYAMELQE